MAGPCSMPVGNKAEWSRMNNIVCDKHYDSVHRQHCTKGNLLGQPDAEHVWVTLRMWLANRSRLVTGKTSRA